jgi:DNA-binding transcriptional regulator YiaG
MKNIDEADEIRIKAGLSKAKAAELLYVSYRQWRMWETKTPLPMGYLELLRLKITAGRPLAEIPLASAVKTKNKSLKAAKKIAAQARADMLRGVLLNKKNKAKVAAKLHVSPRTLDGWLQGSRAISPAYLELLIYCEREAAATQRRLRVLPRIYESGSSSR